MSGASERANGQASGPVLQSVFLVILDHSAREKRKKREEKEGMMGWQIKRRRKGEIRNDIRTRRGSENLAGGGSRIQIGWMLERTEKI